MCVGFEVTENLLEEVAEVSGILESPHDYLKPETRSKFEDVIKDPHKIASKDYVKSYLEVKYSVWCLTNV